MNNHACFMDRQAFIVASMDLVLTYRVAQTVCFVLCAAVSHIPLVHRLHTTPSLSRLMLELRDRT